MPPVRHLHDAISDFGAKAKAKLSNPGVTGAPEDQLRAPLEGLISDLALLCGIPKKAIALSARRR